MKNLADSLVVRFATLLAMIGTWQASLMFLTRTGRFPRLAPPGDHFDKFFWRKLFDHDPKFRIFCDKLACKEWVRQMYPDLSVPDTVWQGASVNDIPADLLVQKIIIKANNGSGFNVRVEERPDDLAAIDRKFSRWLAKPYGQQKAEWGYKHVPRFMYVEKLITAKDGSPPVQMNVYTVMGEPRLVICIVGWKGDYRRASYFDFDGSRLKMQPDDLDPLPEGWRPPPGIRRLEAFARVLAAGSDQMRCDFMVVGDDVWFGEMSVYPLSGLGPVEPDENEVLYGGWNIERSWFLQHEHSGWKRVYANALRRLLSSPG